MQSQTTMTTTTTTKQTKNKKIKKKPQCSFTTFDCVCECIWRCVCTCVSLHMCTYVHLTVDVRDPHQISSVIVHLICLAESGKRWFFFLSLHVTNISLNLNSQLIYCVINLPLVNLYWPSQVLLSPVHLDLAGTEKGGGGEGEQKTLRCLGRWPVLLPRASGCEMSLSRTLSRVFSR